MDLALIHRDIREYAIQYAKPGSPVISPNGKFQNWLIDLRHVFMRRETLERICRVFWQKYQDHDLFQLAGMETAAIPLLTALMLTSPPERGHVNGFIIRKDRKPHGLGRTIEGEIRSDPIILVDDILSSGDSAEKARVVLEQVGRRINELFVVIDYQRQQGQNWRARHAIPTDSLFKLSDFKLSIPAAAKLPDQNYKSLWNVAIPGANPFHVVPKSAPLLVNGKIYRGCDAGKMQCFDSSTGSLLWDYQATGAHKAKGIWSSPAILNGKVYFGAYNGTFYCLDAATGQEVWSEPLGEWIGASPLVIPKHNLVCIGIEYERPNAKGSIAALDALTGEQVWSHHTQRFQHGSASYWEAGDLVIWGTADYDMLGIDAKTGEVTWTFKTQRSVKCAPAIDNDRGWVAFCSFDKSIYLLEASTGRKIGQWETNEICYTSPLIVGNRLFCGSGDRSLYVINLETLEVLKRIEFSARVFSTPRRIGDRVIFGTNSGKVVEVEVDTLEIRGVLQMPDAVTNAIAISADEHKIFVSTYMNQLQAFERI